MDKDSDKDKLREQMADDQDYLDFWRKYRVNEAKFPYRQLATYRLWLSRSPEARAALMDSVRNQGGPSWKNPYFYVQEFKEPEPTYLRGDEPGDLVQVLVDNKYKICTRHDALRCGLDIKKKWK